MYVFGFICFTLGSILGFSLAALLAMGASAEREADALRAALRHPALDDRARAAARATEITDLADWAGRLQ